MRINKLKILTFLLVGLVVSSLFPTLAVGGEVGTVSRQEHATSGVADMFGIAGADIGEALNEDSFVRPAALGPHVPLPSRDLDDSRFLLNGDMSRKVPSKGDFEAEALKEAYWPGREEKKAIEKRVEKARDDAAVQLDFRKTVEEAMTTILAFQPLPEGARVGEVQVPTSNKQSTCNAKGRPSSARERLLRSLCSSP